MVHNLLRGLHILTKYTGDCEIYCTIDPQAPCTTGYGQGTLKVPITLCILTQADREKLADAQWNITVENEDTYCYYTVFSSEE